MRDQERGNNGDEEGGETCSPPPRGVLAAERLGKGGVSRGRRGGWQEFWDEEAAETEMEGSSQALWEHGRIWCGRSLQRGAELCGEADGPSSLVGGMEGCLEPENYHSSGGSLVPSR